jgi:hypothetical protein
MVSRRIALVAVGVASLVGLAPKDCLLGERIPGPDEFRCSSLIGVEWASRTTAYLVMGGIVLLVILAIVLLGRRSGDAR